MNAPLIKRSLVDQALDRLRERIEQGFWQVGERLPTEPELAAELGVSRNTVREAMRVLAFSGVIEIRQGDGSYLRGTADPLDTVQTLSRCTLEQSREVRRMIEAEAIGLAAQRRTEQDLQGLEEALRHSGEHYHHDLDRYIACDLTFHQLLVDAAHNPALSGLYRYFSSQIAQALRTTLCVEPRRQSVFDLHRLILDAVRDGDAERARHLSLTLIEEP